MIKVRRSIEEPPSEAMPIKEEKDTASSEVPETADYSSKIGSSSTVAVERPKRAIHVPKRFQDFEMY